MFSHRLRHRVQVIKYKKPKALKPKSMFRTVKNISNALSITTITIITAKKSRNSMSTILKNKKAVKCKDSKKGRAEGVIVKFSAFFTVLPISPIFQHSL